MKRFRALALFIAALLARDIQAQPQTAKPDFSKSRRESLVNWSGVKPLSKPSLLSGGLLDVALNLNPDERAKIRDIFADKNRQAMELLQEMRARNSAEPFDPTNPQQKAKAANDARDIEALRERLDREAEEEIKAVLEPAQWRRLDELQLQFNGPVAFVQPEFHEQLHLEKNQVSRIGDVLAKARHELMQAVPIRGPGRPSDKQSLAGIPSKRLEASKEFRANATMAIRQILTEAQRADYDKMLGKPLDQDAFIQGKSSTPAKTAG